MLNPPKEKKLWTIPNRFFKHGDIYRFKYGNIASIYKNEIRTNSLYGPNKRTNRHAHTHIDIHEKKTYHLTVRGGREEGHSFFLSLHPISSRKGRFASALKTRHVNRIRTCREENSYQTNAICCREDYFRKARSICMIFLLRWPPCAE